MTTLIVIPSALENSAASFGADRMSGHRTIRVNSAMASAGTQARPTWGRSEDTAELAYRQGTGIEVTLLWHRTSGELTVSVTDVASGPSFELPVAADEALAAFHHPYAYAAAQGVAY